MLRFSTTGFPRTFQRARVLNLRITPQRSLFVIESEKNKSKKSPIKPVKKPSTESRPRKQDEPSQDDNILKAPEELKRSISNLKGFSAEISDLLRAKNTLAVPSQEIDQKVADRIYETKISKRNTKSKEIAAPQASTDTVPELPEKIQQRLGLAPDFILNEKVQNWPLVFKQLQSEGGFTDLKSSDVLTFLKRVPKKQLARLVPVVEKMYEDANLPIPARTYYLFVQALTLGSKLSDAQIQVIEHYVEKLRQLQSLTPANYGTLLTAYSRNGNLTKMDMILKEMKANGVELHREAFKAIIEGYSFYQRDHNKAMQAFDAMRFLSEKTKPTSNEYTTIITSCVLNNEVEKGLDLYEEMLQQNIPINQKLLRTLARGCIMSKQFRGKAWDMMFRIYDNKWTPDIATYEMIMYLAARDGDVDMTRALFYKMLETKTVTSMSFGFLLLSYSRFVPLNERSQFYLITKTERGTNFRRNILLNIDFTKPVLDFPFLPRSVLRDADHVLAESNAIWSYALMHMPNYINAQTVNTYMTIAVNLGHDLTEFKDRYNFATYFDKTGLPATREIEIIEDDKPDQQSNTEVVSLANANHNKIKSPILAQLQDLIKDNRYKAPRDSIMYMLALQAAGKFKNLDFAEEIIKERGQYRKTTAYKSLKPTLREKNDFEFAKAIVREYTRMNLFDDALAVITTTSDMFKWGWKETAPLYNAAVEIDNLWIINEIRTVVRGGQAERGKVTYKDHRAFVLRNKRRH